MYETKKYSPTKLLVIGFLNSLAILHLLLKNQILMKKRYFLLIHISGPENKEKLVKSTQTAILSSEGECVKVQNQVYIHSIIYLHLKF